RAVGGRRRRRPRGRPGPPAAGGRQRRSRGHLGGPMTLREEHVMTHMVIFRHPEGKAGYHQAENVDDAVRFVERLRNQEHVTDARIFRMEEVPIEFRTYYKVELASAPAPAPAAAPAVATEPSNGDAAGLAPQAVLDPAPVEAVAGRGRRLNRG